MITVCIITSYFATFEVLLHAALISRQVQALRRYFRCLTVLGVTLYSVTRLLQTAMLISLFVYGFNPMSHTSKNSALYWVGLFMCTALSALQLYTFIIYKAIWRSTTAKTQLCPQMPCHLCSNGQASLIRYTKALSHEQAVIVHRHYSAVLMASLLITFNLYMSVSSPA